MKKYLKILFIFIFILLIFSLTKSVQANSISKISMDIYINPNGNATVTETWNCNSSQGSEVYHPYYNLGNSSITNLKVSENGNYYTTLSTWNTSGSLSSKANKCGINKISNGVELCWGITNYGTHTYKVEYTITNFVSELTDSQMAYWTLIPYDFSTTIGNVYIKIHTSFDIPNSVGVWGYGNYGGTAYVYDGYIEMQSSGSLASSEYMTILVQFPTGTFNCSNNLNHNFDYYLNMAKEGSTEYQSSNTLSISSLLISILPILFNFALTILILIVCMCRSSKLQSENSLNFGPTGKSIPRDVAYFRDIPCNKNIFRAYYISYNYGLMKNKTDLLGAIILKWMKESKIRIEQKEVGKIFKKEDTVIILNETDTSSIENPKELALFNMLYEASKDGILENKEFERWCSNSYTEILNWFTEILKIERKKLIDEGLITIEEKVKFKFFKYTTYTVTSELKEEAIQLAGLKRYLKDYTRIHDREAIEVAIFEEYLMYAQLMGIAKEVSKQFKDLYPEIVEQSNFSSYDNIIFINMCATNGISHANSARSRAESYSSGGGGFSSGGGGGGSFGGGGGGGGFR